MPVATLDDVPESVAINYAGRDADATFRVDPVLDARIDAVPTINPEGRSLRDCYEMDLAIVPIMERMMSVGMLVDQDHFRALDGHLTDLMLAEVNQCCKLVSGLTGAFNPNSPAQVADLLFSRLKMTPWKQTPTGKDSTQDKVLESLRKKHPVVPHLINYRLYGTMRDDFCLKMVRLLGPDGRMHPNLKNTRVSSGRFACGEPNLLGIPVNEEIGRLIRAGFIAGDGKILGAWDLNQIEMREMAHQSQDPLLLKIYRDGKIDAHMTTACEVFGKKPQDVTFYERQAGKRLNFGIITGITEVGLSEQMALFGVEGWDEATCGRAIREYFNVYRGVRSYLDSCRAEARRYGYVQDRWGRIRYLPGVYSDLKWIRAEAERQSHSFKISASAQGTIKMAMAATWQWLKQQYCYIQPLLQVHDELLFELEDLDSFKQEADTAITYYMCETTHMSVPIKAKGLFASNWGELKD